ncbi:hypothetical protein BDN71DRAFT_1564663, partial [Pleurotus eryngii]
MTRSCPESGLQDTSIIYPASSVVLAHRIVSSTMGNAYSQSSISLSTCFQTQSRLNSREAREQEFLRRSPDHHTHPAIQDENTVNFNLHQVDVRSRSKNEGHENELSAVRPPRLLILQPPATVPWLSGNEELENVLNVKTRQHSREKSLPRRSATRLQIVDQLLSKPVESASVLNDLVLCQTLCVSCRHHVPLNRVIQYPARAHKYIGQLNMGRMIRTATNLFMAARRAYIDPPTRHDLGYMNIQCPHCSALHWNDERTYDSRRRATPAFGTCCNHGKVQLPPPRPPPETLRLLLEADDPQSREF